MYIKNMKAQIYFLQPYDLLNKIERYKKIFNGTIEECDIIKLQNDSMLNKNYKLIEDKCFYEKISIGHELNDGIKDSHPGISGHNVLSEIIINHIKKYNKYNEFKTNKLI